MYAMIPLVLRGTGTPQLNDIEAVQRFATYQLALNFCMVACFFVNFAASIRYLTRHWPGADAMAIAAAEVGLLFCCAFVVAGAVASHRFFAVWWAWSTTGTAALLLSFVYASYLILRRYANVGQCSTLAAILGVFAFVDIPLTYVSIAMRNATRHVAGPGIVPSAEYRPLVETSIGFLFFAATAVAVRYRKKRLRQQADDQEAFADH